MKIQKESNSDQELEPDSRWAQKNLETHEKNALTSVPTRFIADKFNYNGLKTHFPNLANFYFVMNEKEKVSILNEKMGYLLLHQRYILTKEGMKKMYQKIVINRLYGECRRIGCEKICLIPIGVHNSPHLLNSKVFCYNCENIYEGSLGLGKIDGCAFGNNFPHVFALKYKKDLRKSNFNKYEPRIFGFKIHKPLDEENSNEF